MLTCGIGERIDAAEISANFVGFSLVGQTAAYPIVERGVGREAEGFCHAGSHVQAFVVYSVVADVVRLLEIKPEPDCASRSLEYLELQRHCWNRGKITVKTRERFRYIRVRENVCLDS